MKFLDLARQRYSLRKYSERPVPRVLIERCIEAARLAPSACNSQPWSFIVIDYPPFRERFSRNVFGGIYRMNSFAEKAPVIIAVITRASSAPARVGGLFQGTSFNLVDVGITSEHLALQAAEDGLGTCMLGWFDKKKASRMLGISSPDRIDLLISLGYPAEDRIPEKKRNPLDSIMKYNL